MMVCRDIDEHMMEFLYRELEAPRAQAFQAHVEACQRCQAELGDLELTRRTLRSLPDAEPPPRVSARLLHEAAQRAVSGKRGGILGRLFGAFTPLGMHPALAAALSLVLVAGVAGVLLRDKVSPSLEAARSAHAPQAPVSRAETPSSYAPAQDEPAEGTDRELPPPARVGRQLSPGAETQLSVAEEREGKSGRSLRPTEARKYKSDDQAPVETGGAIGEADTGASRLAGKPTPPSAFARAPENDEFAPAPRAQTPPAAPVPSGAAVKELAAPSSVTRDQARQVASKKVKTEDAAPTESSLEPSDPKRIHGQARAAAQTGDCKRANELKARVAKMDAEYYRLRVYADSVLGRCAAGKKAQKSAPAQAPQPPAEK